MGNSSSVHQSPLGSSSSCSSLFPTINKSFKKHKQQQHQANNNKNNSTHPSSPASSSTTTITTTTTSNKNNEPGLFRRSVCSLSSSKQQHQPKPRGYKDLKSPKGSKSFSQIGSVNNHSPNHNNNNTQAVAPSSACDISQPTKLPSFSSNTNCSSFTSNNNLQISITTYPSLSTLSSLDPSTSSSSTSLNLRHATSNGSLSTISTTNSTTTTTTTTATTTHNNSASYLKVTDPVVVVGKKRSSSNSNGSSTSRSPTSIQFGSKVHSTLELPIIQTSASAPSHSSPVSSKYDTTSSPQQQHSNTSSPSPNSFNSSNNHNGSNNSLNQFLKGFDSPNYSQISIDIVKEDKGEVNERSLEQSQPLVKTAVLDEKKVHTSRDCVHSPKLVSTDSLTLITPKKRAGAKVMFERDLVNNNSREKNRCEKVEKDEDGDTTFDVNMMKGKNTTTINSPTGSSPATPQVESVEESSKNHINSPVRSLVVEDKPKIDSPITGSPPSKESTLTHLKSSLDDECMESGTREMPTLKALKQLRSEKNLRKRTGSLNKMKKSIVDIPEIYLGENDGISNRIKDILKDCEDLLGDVPLEPKSPCTIEVTKPDVAPASHHLTPVQNSRQFRLLTVPTSKQAMRDSRMEQRQHEKKQKNMNKDVASIIKDIRSSFSEFDF